MKYSLTTVARLYAFVREAEQNKGQRVEAIQRWSGGVPGESWCAYFATMVLDICFQGQSPIPRLGACQDIYDLAKKNNWLVTAPQKDDLFLYVDENNHAHHVGIVTDPAPIGIAGNTSADGKSSNGNGVFEHGISNDPTKVKFVRFPK